MPSGSIHTHFSSSRLAHSHFLFFFYYLSFWCFLVAAHISCLLVFLKAKNETCREHLKKKNVSDAPVWKIAQFHLLKNVSGALVILHRAAATRLIEPMVQEAVREVGEGHGRHRGCYLRWRLNCSWKWIWFCGAAGGPGGTGGMGGMEERVLADGWLPHTQRAKIFCAAACKDVICGGLEMISSPLLFSPVPCACYTAPDGLAPTRSSHTSFEEWRLVWRFLQVLCWTPGSLRCWMCRFHTLARSRLPLSPLPLPPRLTLEQKELCRSRLKLLAYLDRLATYEVTIAGCFFL